MDPRRCCNVDLGQVGEDDPDDPMRTALRQMVGVFAQLERGMVTARIRAGKKLKLEEGGYAHGSPPFCYRAEDGALVADDDEQEALAGIRELHEAGESLRKIAQKLTSEGYRPKRSKRWHPASLARILARL